MTPKRILILGTGHMAHHHARELGRLPGAVLVAGVDSNRERADAFTAGHALPHAFGSLEDALAWGAFDAAVNATPDAAHTSTTLALIAAGKAVFCEKPLALDAVAADAMTAAAEAAGVVNMVNLPYRNAAALQQARAMVEAGQLGTIRHIEASYLQSWLTARHWGDWRTEERWLWRLSTEHGSKGVLGDIGVHLLDFVSFGSGLDVAALGARLRTFDKAPGNRIGAYGLDANDSVVLTVEMANGALGVVNMSRFATGNANDLTLNLYGETGALRVWANSETSRLDGCFGPDLDTQRWRPIPTPETPRNEARFVEALQTGVNGQPDFRHAATVQRLLDLCFQSDREGRTLRVA